MQPQDLASVITVSEPAVSPDGRTVAVVVARPDVELNRTVSTVWLVSAHDGTMTELQTGSSPAALVGSPRWSPDGRWIAVTRTYWPDERSETALLVLPSDQTAEGGPKVIATTEEAISSLTWAPTSDRLAWCARVGEVPRSVKDRDRPPRRITTLVSRLDDEGWTTDRRLQVHVSPIDGAGSRQLTTGPFDHSRVAWAPDGTRLAVLAGRHDGWDLDEVVDVYLVEAGDAAQPPQRLSDGTLRWSEVAWSPSGDRLAGVAVEPSTGWRNPRLLSLDVASGEMADLAPDLDRTFTPTPGGRAPIWEDDARGVLVSYEDHGRVSLVRVPLGGGEREALIGGDRWVLGFDVAGGTVAAVVSDVQQHAELEVVGAGLRTAFTAAFAAAVPARPTVRFSVPTSTDEDDLDVWLVTPEGFDPDAEPAAHRWPLLLSVHGGPMSQYGERWFDEFQLLAGAGFVVVATNPHGSSGRSTPFQRAVRSPLAAVDPGTGWGGLDAEDLLSVVDATLARWPALDPTRVGVLGGSYGGFMTTWLLAHSDRFAAGVSERAVNNLLSEEWSSDIAGFFQRELGVSHIAHRDEYLRMSPVTYADQITAPIMILHSENDLRCPTEQADALFVALRLGGHPDVEYWRFPGEGHEMSRSGSPLHRRQRAELINAFFTRTLGAGPR